MTFLLNFVKELAPLVESGSKLQTIRANRKDGRRPKVGEELKLYTGLRTKGVRLLRPGTPAIDVFPIQMHITRRTIVSNGIPLLQSEIAAMAERDGFKDAIDFFAWFAAHHEDYFEGWCVRWRSRGDA